MSNVITIKFPESQLVTLAEFISTYSYNRCSEQRWSQDRDKSEEWRSVSEKLSHFAYCPFRQKITGKDPIEVDFPKSVWVQVRKIIREEKNHSSKPHALYTVIYPAKIKEFKQQLRAIKKGSGFVPDLTKDPKTIEKAIAQFKEDIIVDRKFRSELTQKLSYVLELLKW